MSRSFTVEKINNSSPRNPGRYISANPSGAARKAFTQYSRNKSLNNAIIIMRETTRGVDNDKLYKYKVSRKKLDPPVETERNGIVVTYKYKTVVKAKK